MNIPLYTAYASLPSSTVRKLMLANVHYYRLAKLAPYPSRGQRLNALRVFKEGAREACRVLADRVDTVTPRF